MSPADTPEQPETEQPESVAEGESPARLEQISTRWSLLELAHQAPTELSGPARSELVLKYTDAIRTYIRAMTRDENVADDLTQDVVVRLLQGDFGGADPKRGRFRNLLKVAVRNMVRTHWSKTKRRTGVDHDLEAVQSGDEDSAASFEREWVEGWRQSPLDLTWRSLEAQQNRQKNSVAYTILKLRADEPDLDSTELAERLTELSGREFKPPAARQQLRRARLRFAEFLIEELVRSLEDASPASIEAELQDLGLMEFVGDFLPPDWMERGELAGEEADGEG